MNFGSSSSKREKNFHEFGWSVIQGNFMMVTQGPDKVDFNETPAT
jgi:hypothetical protein